MEGGTEGRKDGWKETRKEIKGEQGEGEDRWRGKENISRYETLPRKGKEGKGREREVTDQS